MPGPSTVLRVSLLVLFLIGVVLWQRLSFVLAQTVSLPSIPQTCPSQACSANLTCKEGNCVQCGGEEIFPPMEESSLREYAQKRGILVGTPSQFSKGEQHRKVLAKEFNVAGMINYMKFIWPERDRFDFTIIDKHIRFARENNLRLAGLSLIYSNRGTPQWLGFYNHETQRSDPNCGGWGENEQKRQELDNLMKKFIQAAVRRGGKDVYIWKLVNEPLTQMKYSCWAKVLGKKDYIAKAFRYAHEANPDALLMLNDTFGRDRIDQDKVDKFMDLVTELKQQNVPIDVVGIEMHLEAHKLRENYGSDFLTALENDFRYFLEKAQGIKVQVHVTEMDVYQGPEGYFENPFEVQKQIYKRVVKTCLEYSHCTGFFTWGVSDKYAWRPDQQDTKPLLFDENYRRKMAYYGVMEALAENTSRSCRWQTNHKFISIGHPNRQFTDEEIKYIAKNFDLVTLEKNHANWKRGKHHEDVRRLKQVNPNLKVFAYFPATLRFDKATYFTDSFQDSWYLRDSNGDIITAHTGGKYVDVSNAEYRRWVLRVINWWLSQAPYDGVYFDNAFFIGHDVHTQRNRQWWERKIGVQKIDEFNAGLENLIRQTRQVLDPRKKVLFNGFAIYGQNVPTNEQLQIINNNRLYTRNLKLLDYADGVHNERFCYRNTPDSVGEFSPKEMILEDIRIQQEYARQGKTVEQKTNYFNFDWVESEYKQIPLPDNIEEIRQKKAHIGRYCYGSFLLGHVPGYTYYKFGYLYRHHELKENPAEMQLNLGNPVGDYQQEGLVYKRQFQNGWLFVNMEDTSQMVTLPEDLVLMESNRPKRRYQVGETLILSPRDAAFLLKPYLISCSAVNLNCDGVVNLADLLHWRALFAAGEEGVDTNSDGKRNILDYLQVLRGWLE